MSTPDQPLDAQQAKAERKQQKKAAKALKKETNSLLDRLHEQGNQAQYDASNALYGVHAYDQTLAKLSKLRPELGPLALPVEIVQLLTKAEELVREHASRLLNQADAQLFPGRAERLDADAETSYQDSRTATMEKYAGYTGG